MQQLRAQLEPWHRAIKRGVGATEIEVIPMPQDRGEFILKVTWRTPNGERVQRTYERLFSQEFVFGRTYGGDPLALAVQKRACDYARDFMREVLNMRGAL